MTTTTHPTIFLVAGARPNFVKLAALVHAFGPWQDRLTVEIVHTGQHYDHAMSAVFFEQLGIPAPTVDLGVGSGSHAVQTAKVMVAFEELCLARRPAMVVVVGDVNSTLACTLVAAKLGIPVAHVEAGLRSGDRSMPEEINRIVVDALADLLLAPSADAAANLEKEGIPAEKIFTVGNVMIDSLVRSVPAARESVVALCGLLRLPRRGYVYVTLHRPSNVDDPRRLIDIVMFLEELATRMPVVFPVHPRTRVRLDEMGLAPAGVHLIEPLGYLEAIGLLEGCRLALTDSGGIQEESTWLRVPCLTLRPNTERPVTIEIGSNQLTSIATLPADVTRVLEAPERFGAVPPLWDGRAGLRSAEVIAEALGLNG